MSLWRIQKAAYSPTAAFCLEQRSVFTLVLLWHVLIGSKDFDGGESSDAILAPQ